MKELLRLWRFYQKEAHRCTENKAYLAGCIMAGSVMETQLILMVDMYPDEAAATNKLPTRKKVVEPLLKWKLAELLPVAKAAGWLPSGLNLSDEWCNLKAKVGDYAEVTRQLRNLLHPSRYLEDHYRKRVTAKHAHMVFDTMDAVNDFLLATLNKSLLKSYEQEQLNKTNTGQDDND
ncbi:MAG: hypothetical protein HQK99_00840 [Nitrospirae bacterium]|nr:hypothetical protein [Nitrospirota bacterium]